MTYKELQKEAGKLGIKAVGVKADELERLVNEAKNGETNNEQSEVNTAIVYRGIHEVRRYSLAQNGENFKELAQEFASSRGYTVSLIFAGEGVVCPNCGHQFNPNADMK